MAELLCMCTTPSLSSSSTERHVGCFHGLATVNNAAVTILMDITFAHIWCIILFKVQFYAVSSTIFFLGVSSSVCFSFTMLMVSII